MSDRDSYISLVTSLPGPERLFLAKQPPLSRLRLEKRLASLEPEDRTLLAELEHFMAWGSYSMGDSDQTSITRAKALLSRLESSTLRKIVTERLDLRAAIAGLRMRRRGDPAPTAPWSASRLTRHIVQHWTDPTFELDARLPWIGEALRLLEKQDPLGLERFVLDVTHRQLKRHGARHSFDFEAVVIYVLQWSIFERWARSDGRGASARFESLTRAALADFQALDLEAFSR
ncbi:MAG: hypothetical protein AAF646_05340 [Pseudomonadota bacterium]